MSMCGASDEVYTSMFCQCTNEKCAVLLRLGSEYKEGMAVQCPECSTPFKITPESPVRFLEDRTKLTGRAGKGGKYGAPRGRSAQQKGERTPQSARSLKKEVFQFPSPLTGVGTGSELEMLDSMNAPTHLLDPTAQLGNLTPRGLADLTSTPNSHGNLNPSHADSPLSTASGTLGSSDSSRHHTPHGKHLTLMPPHVLHFGPPSDQAPHRRSTPPEPHSASSRRGSKRRQSVPHAGSANKLGRGVLVGGPMEEMRRVSDSDRSGRRHVTERKQSSMHSPEPHGSNLMGMFSELQNASTPRAAQYQYRTPSIAPTSPLGCRYCGKVFKKAGRLVTHERKHTGERPYSCSECTKSFRDAAALEGHISRQHRTQPFSCEICHKGFASQRQLTIHIRVHSGEKPFQCVVCDRSFSQDGNLQTHIRRHMANFGLEAVDGAAGGERSKQRCKLCGIVLNSVDDLKSHVKVHIKANDLHLLRRLASAGGVARGISADDDDHAEYRGGAPRARSASVSMSPAAATGMSGGYRRRASDIADTRHRAEYASGMPAASNVASLPPAHSVGSRAYAPPTAAALMEQRHVDGSPRQGSSDFNSDEAMASWFSSFEQ
eukprot:m.1121800 g.1121800  ORF g.1121800 m.1121800 type:complete len:603 (-) comp24400_c0_seq8:1765-3573(-)